jgi:hypothetical protein
MSRIKLLALSALFAGSTSVFAGPINVFDYNSLTATKLVTFSDVAAGNYDGAVVSGGVGFSERFVGQTVSTVAGADVLTGAPDLTHSLVGAYALPPSGRNLVVTPEGTLGGLGATGVAGVGAVSILFPGAQTQFGLQVDGINGNSQITFSFFSRNGSLIDTEVIDTGSTTGTAFYGFASGDLGRSLGLTADIAGISITTTDAGGLFYDNIKWGSNQLPFVTSVPEPETYALMFAGLSAVGFAAKRRRKNASA